MGYKGLTVWLPFWGYPVLEVNCSLISIPLFLGWLLFSFLNIYFNLKSHLFLVFLFFFRIYFIFALCVCLCVQQWGRRESVHVRIRALGVQRRVGPLNLELWVVVNLHPWVLGIELRSSANIGNIGYNLESAEGTM